MSDVREIELAIEAAKAVIEFGKALERLEGNKDFQTVIRSAYLKDEAVRLVHSKGNPDTQKPEHQAAIVRDMDGIASLVSFLRGIRQAHEKALTTLSDNQSELEYAQKEEADQ